MANSPVISLEFNELSPEITNRFIDQGKLPNFSRLKNQSKVFTTEAREEQKNLEPWIQWVTVHSGLSYKEHGVFDLGDGHKLKAPTISQLLSKSGYKVWLCGSMNVPFGNDTEGFVLPDAWSTASAPHPPELTPYWKFIRTNVQEHTNDSVPLTAKDYLGFSNFMVRHGLSADTVFAVIKQLVSQKISGKKRWKKAALLNRIQWDVFKWFYQKHQPDFSTFFLNSTAHYQHAYWRYFAPEQFEIQPTQEELDEYGDAVLFGYQEMDTLIGKVLDMASDDTTVILCTALSQQPFLKYEEKGGKTFYRPHSFDKLLDSIALDGVTNCQPIMSEEFRIYFETREQAKAAKEYLEKFRVGNETLFLTRLTDTSLHAGCRIFNPLPDDAVILWPDSERTEKFSSLFYKAPSTVKSGMHHPDGILWVKRPRVSPEVVKEKVSLQVVAPMILKMFGIKPEIKMQDSSILER